MNKELRQKQIRFVKMVGKLINYACSEGYSLTFGDAYRDPRCNYGHQNSLHRIRLAIDFNLFDNNGNYLTKTEDFKRLGKYWKEVLGGTWGGDFGDGNHFSLEYKGMK